MEKKLLYLFSAFLGIGSLLHAQDRVWDFGNDLVHWPLNNVALTATTVVDGLTLEPGGGSSFGIVEPNAATWFEGTSNEYSSINRFKSGGNSGIDPADGESFMPKRRYLSIPIEGPVAVKIWFRQGGSSTPRDLWITDGTQAIAHYEGKGDTDPQYLEANYTGTGNTIYILFAHNAYNLYKIEVSSNLLNLSHHKMVNHPEVKAWDSRVHLLGTTGLTHLQIFNTSGQQICAVKAHEDISFALPSGFYIARISSGNYQKVTKLLIP